MVYPISCDGVNCVVYRLGHCALLCSKCCIFLIAQCAYACTVHVHTGIHVLVLLIDRSALLSLANTFKILEMY